MQTDGKKPKVWENTAFCINKIIRDRTLRMISKIQKILGIDQWKKFVAEIKKN